MARPARKPSSKRRHYRAVVAGLLSGGATADDARLIEARRGLRACELEDEVTRVLAGQPELTVSQRVRIASLVLQGVES